MRITEGNLYIYQSAWYMVIPQEVLATVVMHYFSILFIEMYFNTMPLLNIQILQLELTLILCLLSKL